MLSETELKQEESDINKDNVVECYGQQCDSLFCHSMANKVCHFEVVYTDLDTDELIKVEDFNGDLGEVLERLDAREAGLLCKLCYAEYEYHLQEERN